MRGSKANPILCQTRHVALALVLIAAVCAVQLYAMPRGERHESRHEIDQLEDQWRDAFLKGNTAAMDTLLADDYVAITANGMLQSKAQTLTSLRDGMVHLTALDLIDRKVRFYGATALVTSLAQVSGKNGESDISGNYRYTRVYVRDEQGKWKIVSFEVSRIRDTGERK